MPNPVLARRFRHNQSGLAIIEFSLILPVLVLIAVATFDLARYIICIRKIEMAASTMAELLARNDTKKVSQTDLLAVSRAQLVIFPESMQAARDQKVSVWTLLKWSLSGVQFKTTAGCTSNCTYVPYVSWTSGQGRPCTVPLSSAPNTSKPTATTLPSDTFGPGFLVVADVTFTYKPILLQSIIGTVVVSRSFYINPRYVSTIAFDSSAGTGSAWACVVP